MKTKIKQINKVILIVLLTSKGMFLFAQSKPRLAVLNIDSKAISADPVLVGDLVRLEIEKLGNYEIMDRYDVIYLTGKNKLQVSDCYGKLCLIEIGKSLNAEKMMSGTVERFGDKIVLSLRLIDVNTGSIEKSQVNEFLNLPDELQKMVAISLHTMFGLPNDIDIVEKLTKKNDYEASLNNPHTDRLNLSGPRMGLNYVFGENGQRLYTSKRQGGFEAFPMMTQFGYQFETQYLNEGNFQALFEYIPIVTGIDQGLFIPSFTLLNGLRNSRTGWEFAFGPTFGLARMAEGYYENNVWHLKAEWREVHGNIDNPHDLQRRPDRRGDVNMVTGFVLAVGKTFKSGNLNVPVNAYVIPDKYGWRAGVSVGFNGKNRNSKHKNTEKEKVSPTL